MPVETGALLTSLGDCLRTVREQKGLTLEQAAEISGISKSYLSRLETSDRQPSVASLLALSGAYGVPVGAFFGETRETTPLSISLPDEPRYESNGLTIAACSGYAGSTVIDALRMTVSPDRVSPSPARHPGEEWLYVVGGTLILEFANTVHRLEAGTTAHLNAELPHRLGAEVTDAEVLLVAAKPLRNLHNIH